VYRKKVFLSLVEGKREGFVTLSYERKVGFSVPHFRRDSRRRRGKKVSALKNILSSREGRKGEKKKGGKRKTLCLCLALWEKRRTVFTLLRQKGKGITLISSGGEKKRRGRERVSFLPLTYCVFQHLKSRKRVTKYWEWA